MDIWQAVRPLPTAAPRLAAENRRETARFLLACRYQRWKRLAWRVRHPEHSVLIARVMHSLNRHNACWRAERSLLNRRGAWFCTAARERWLDGR